MNQQLDPVSVAVVLFTILVSPELAEIVGPYTVIILAASTGAVWALGARDSTSRVNAFVFVAKINLTAVLLTVGIVKLISFLWPSFPAMNWILAPVALVLGGIGDNWPRIGEWLLRRVGVAVDRRVGGGP